MFENGSEVAAAVAGLLRRGEVRVDDRPAVGAPSAEEVVGVLWPLLAWCAAHRPTEGRGLVGIAAPAGAGKTHVLAWLAATARVLKMPNLAFLSMDGYHLPNAALESRTGVDVEGKVVSLRQLKGTPASFDAEALLADLRRLKANRDMQRLPKYSRQLHEPVPEALCVGSEVDWVFIEGNFLFLAESPWTEIHALLDRRVFIDMDEQSSRHRLAHRHAASGRDPAGFEGHYRRVDQPNNRLIRSTRSRAQLIWNWSPDGKLQNQAAVQGGQAH